MYGYSVHVSKNVIILSKFIGLETIVLKHSEVAGQLLPEDKARPIRGWIL
jgi:hypothetical protein